MNEILVQSLDSLQKQILETRQSAILSERVGGKSLAEIKSLRDDLATLMVGVLTKIGQPSAKKINDNLRGKKRKRSLNA